LQINKPTTKKHSTNQSKVKTINLKEKQKNYCGENIANISKINTNFISMQKLTNSFTFLNLEDL
jgi:hypothetical protein